MAFPTSAHDDLERAWSWIRDFAGQVRDSSSSLSATAAATSIGADQVVRYLDGLVNARVMLNRAVNVPGILAYVRSQINDATIDIAAEWTTMSTQIDATIAWVIANFPHDGNGFLLYEHWDANGNRIIRTLTTGQTGGLVTQLNALVATIAAS